MTQAMSSWFSLQGPCVVIAEIGVNHNGSLDLAREMIDVAAAAGADAVKFQTFSAERLAIKGAEKAAYQKANDGAGEDQFSMLKRLEFSKENLIACRDHCKTRKIAFLSTPFDEEAADLLEDVGVEGFKLSSGDLTNLGLLRHVASKGLPMIISTGMADLAETERAVMAIEQAGDPALAILHCVSNYPALPSEANLRAMDTLTAAFRRPVGWSDHTLGDAVTLAAVARGARIIEKHFTLDTSLPGPDHKASLTPHELKQMIASIRIVESALGDGVKRPQPSELDTARVARRSLVMARDVAEGEVLKESDFVCKRPGTGIEPYLLPHLLGRRAARDLPVDTQVSFADIS